MQQQFQSILAMSANKNAITKQMASLTPTERKKYITDLLERRTANLQKQLISRNIPFQENTPIPQLTKKVVLHQNIRVKTDLKNDILDMEKIMNMSFFQPAKKRILELRRRAGRDVYEYRRLLWLWMEKELHFLNQLIHLFKQDPFYFVVFIPHINTSKEYIPFENFLRRRQHYELHFIKAYGKTRREEITNDMIAKYLSNGYKMDVHPQLLQEFIENTREYKMIKTMASILRSFLKTEISSPSVKRTHSPSVITSKKKARSS